MQVIMSDEGDTCKPASGRRLGRRRQGGRGRDPLRSAGRAEGEAHEEDSEPGDSGGGQ